MNKQLIIIGVCITLAAWFLLDEKKTFWEKVFIVIILVFLYFAYRLMSGATVHDILAPLTTDN